MEFSPSTVGALLILAIVLAMGAIGAAAVAIQGQRRVRQAYSRFSQGSREDVITLLDRHIGEVGALRRDVRNQQAYGAELRALIGRTISRVGTVRYDAFDDMGGRLSFSIALLDEHGDGSVVTAMNGRVQTRTYAKPVVGGTSPHNLSEEEVTAITQAMAPPRRALRPRQAAARRPATTPVRSAAARPIPEDAGDQQAATELSETTDDEPADLAPSPVFTDPEDLLAPPPDTGDVASPTGQARP